MRMTRGHFDAIAAVLRDERPDRDGTRWADGARDEWSTTVLAFARLCRDASNLTPNGNRAFDRERFLAACGFADAAYRCEVGRVSDGARCIRPGEHDGLCLFDDDVSVTAVSA